MSEGKKGFVLYVDQRGIFKKLTDDQAGKLIKHVFSYVSDENPEGDFITELAFESIMQQLKRDLKKYEKSANRSRENGKLGGRPKEPRKPSGLIDNPNEPRKPVTDTVTVTDTVNVTVNVNEYIITEICNFAWSLFPKDIRPKEKNEKWIDTIDKLIRIDNKKVDEIKKVIKWAREDDFWKSNFLSLTKLRIKNKDGIKYYDIFNENRKNGKSNGTAVNTKTFSAFNPDSFPSHKIARVSDRNGE